MSGKTLADSSSNLATPESASTSLHPASRATPEASSGKPLAGAEHAAVVGLQWGDEGKGQLVDLLTSRFDMVIRYNGGANAGHSVHIGDQKFALHLVPSGILNPEQQNVVANGVVIDPEQILKEVDGLRERGVAVGDNLRISERAHVVMPYHKLQDGLMDHAIARTRGDEQRIGTTGRGIGPCYADKALRTTSIRMCELISREALRDKLQHIVPLKNLLLRSLAEHCGEPFTPLDADELTDRYAALGDRLRPHVCDSFQLIQDAMERGKRLLFEGANAALLDVDHGTYPFVTSSSTTSLGLHPGAGVAGSRVGQVLGVLKLYTSRVGGGPFPTELFDDTVDRIRERGSEFGTTTGRPRRCGWLDLVAVRYSARLNGATDLVCTGLSVLQGLESLKICVGYRVGERTLTSMPADAAVLASVEPVYETLPGFDEDVSGCTRFADLPAAARGYLERVEQVVGTRVSAVCVGRRRDQVLVRELA